MSFLADINVSDLFGFEYLAIMIAFGVSAMIPGADFAVVLRQSIVHGRRAALLTSLGISTAILFHGSYTLLGLGLIISQSLLLFSIIKVVGALYLLWVGISTFMAPAPQKPDFKAAISDHSLSDTKAFALGFFTNLLNPKAVLFFVSLFSVIVSSQTVFFVKTFYIFSMSIELFLWFGLVSIFFTTPAIREWFYAIGRWFNRIAGATLVCLAIRVAFSRPQ